MTVSHPTLPISACFYYHGTFHYRISTEWKEKKNVIVLATVPTLPISTCIYYPGTFHYWFFTEWKRKAKCDSHNHPTLPISTCIYYYGTFHVCFSPASLVSSIIFNGIGRCQDKCFNYIMLTENNSKIIHKNETQLTVLILPAEQVIQQQKYKIISGQLR